MMWGWGKTEKNGSIGARLGVPEPESAQTLALYQFASCPYCQRVMQAARRLSIDLDLRDTLRDPEARSWLRAATGGTQVPCLAINGEPLLESADIIDWLEAYAKVRGGGAANRS
jgi:glutaredoxin